MANKQPRQNVKNPSISFLAVSTHPNDGEGK